MAKKARGADAADAVRSAVDRTVSATLGQAQITRERAQEMVDEATQAAARVRDVIDDLRLVTNEDVKSLRGELSALERRVARLESALALRARTDASRAKKPAAATRAKPASSTSRRKPS